MVYLTPTGMPRDTRPSADELFFWFDPQGAWRPSREDLSGDLEAECLRLQVALLTAIFVNPSIYYDALAALPDGLLTAGMNSESNLSRHDFAELLQKVSSTAPVISKILYLFDCRRLVAGIQECTKEVMFLQGEFYRVLNLEQLFYPPIRTPDGIRWVTSPPVTYLHALLGFIYIRLHSLLDYSTKLAFEVENLRSEFSQYPRMRSSKITFGDRKRLSFPTANSLFEPSDVVTEVEVFRNHVIHDGLLDDMPKVYTVVKGGTIVEKFILAPDRGAEGRLKSHVNRRLFYSSEDRINLRLPQLISSFQARQARTLHSIYAALISRDIGA